MFMGVDFCEGGAERADSVRAGLAKVSPEATHIAIHDAARPMVTPGEVDRVFAAAVQTGAAILATPVTATLKRVVDGRIVATQPRESLWAAQTPQAFELGLYRRAVEASEGAAVTDDAQLVERLGEPVTIVEGSPQNLKITTQEDLKLASSIFAAKPPAVKKAAEAFEDDDIWG
jgi:2-C-methyl-D-erythritol 4-phosphate cytidylyltransferase